MMVFYFKIRYVKYFLDIDSGHGARYVRYYKLACVIILTFVGGRFRPLFMERIDLTAIPLTPGIYLFKDAGGRVVYVGKAKVLRKRLASYFRPDETLTPKTRAMLRMARTVDTISTTTEKEALLLEASLIKKHRPRYNIVLRDDKQYVLFKLTTQQEWPRLTLTRKVVRDGATYFGPYTSAQAARDTWKAVHGLFRLRRCSDKAFRNRVRPCLYHYMGHCFGPCCLPVDNALYREQVSRVEMLLKGRSSELLDLLHGQMLDASEAMAFEQAAVLRDQIAAIRRTVEKQAAVLHNARDADVIGMADTGKGVALGVLFIRGGILLDTRNFFWSGLSFEEAPEVLLSFLAQFYGPQSVIPPRIVLPWALESDAAEPGREDADASGEQGAGLVALAESLADMRGGTVRIVSPGNDTENRLVTMAQTNAVEAARTAREQDVAAILAARLDLQAPPVRIEAVDVSHTSGRDTRVGMVVFMDGKPAKEHYRTYAFADEEAGGDDYAVLARWMERRLESGPPWPDLLLVDGGRGQLGAVCSVLREQGAEGLFAVASIAKARTEEGGRPDRRKGNVADAIFLPGRSNPVSMRPGSSELLFLQLVRDSVHDYSIRRHRKARAGTALAAELQRIEGVGPALAKALWTHFSSLREMADASEEQLAAVPGVGRAKAQRIRAGLAAMRTQK